MTEHLEGQRAEGPIGECIHDVDPSISEAQYRHQAEKLVNHLFPRPKWYDRRKLFKTKIITESELRQRNSLLPKEYTQRLNDSCLIDDEDVFLNGKEDDIPEYFGG